MKCFYQLYNSASLNASLEYSFAFCGYVDNLSGIQRAIAKGLLGKCKFSKRTTKFHKAFYPITETSPVKNTYDIGRHHLITGPNAAGKTTLLKATMLNVVLSQQIGYGCYEKATITPFDQIHCYINIPDTSGRDSLFQAEARRCRDILEAIKMSDVDTRHFCVFDELYSGTNPYEAIGTAAAYLTYLNKFPNVSFMLTTHFLGLCERLKRQRRFLNCHMQVKQEGEDFQYTYKLTRGVSDVKGGVKVLKDLEYPDEIIRETKNVISEIII
jgi:DNA mismatch repair ATPase MutS